MGEFGAAGVAVEGRQRGAGAVEGAGRPHGAFPADPAEQAHERPGAEPAVEARSQARTRNQAPDSPGSAAVSTADIQAISVKCTVQAVANPA
ncbi:hypothetical protein JCM9533A_32940 [Catenuloplanes niger JCM 9533]